MAEAISLLQTLNSFETTTSPFNLTLYGSINSGSGGTALIRPYTYPTSTPTARGSIVLPNGAKYDPHQTYDSPVTPGELSYTVILKPGGVSSLEETESAITGYYNDFCVLFVGKRGTLYGASYGITSSISVTARLLSASLNWGLPKQIPTAIGGQGSGTPGIKTARITFTFDLLDKWSFTY